jgi:hypothetical protein
LSFVHGLTCKWISAQEPRLMRYKSLIKTALGLELVRLNLGWIGQDKLSLNSKEKYLCPVNRYNGSVIVLTVHLNTKKYFKTEKLSKKLERIVK